MVDRAGLIDLWEEIAQAPEFEHFRLPGINFVPGVGPDHPKAMMLGEAPGAQENFKKRPFVGAAGKVLAQLMLLAGLNIHTNAWLTNTIKFRPPMNRTPIQREVQDAQPFLRREWALIGKPRVLIAVGAVAWRAMAPPEHSVTSLSKVVGEPIYSGMIALWPMFHPAFGMRNESMRPTMQEHWEKLGDWLREEFGNEFGSKGSRQVARRQRQK